MTLWSLETLVDSRSNSLFEHVKDLNVNEDIIEKGFDTKLIT